MVVSCSALGCTQRYEQGVTLHSFPKDEERVKQWLIAMKREKWIPKKSSILCSRHFSSDCYNTSGWASRKSLKSDAVPSIFEFPEHPQKSPGSGSSRKKRGSTKAELDFVAVPERTSFDVEEEHISDGSIDDASTPRRNEETAKDLSTPLRNEEPTEDVSSLLRNGESTENVSTPRINEESTEYISTARRRKRVFIGDFKGDPSQFSYDELCLFYKLAKKELAKKDSRIRFLKQRNRRLQGKVNNVKAYLDHLFESDMIVPVQVLSIEDEKPFNSSL